MSEPNGGKKKTTRADWAVRYIKLGWAVLPLRGKIPLVPNGSKDATLNESQAREWWQKWPDANIGAATGHRFFVLDVDIKKGGEDSFDHLKLQYGWRPDTLQQITGTGGKHLLFQMPDFPVKNSESWVGPGLDIRGAGGYIVVAPSIHPETSRRYAWDGAQELEDEIITPAPGWLLDKLRTQGFQQSGAKPAAPVSAVIPEGQRNSTIFKLACSLRRRGLTGTEILATIKAANELRCIPPLELSELQTIANSSERYSPDARGNLFPTGNAGGRKESGELAAGTNGSAGSPPDLPLAAADVEAAIDDAITRNDLVGALRLIPEIAQMRIMVQAVIKAKLKLAFGRDFPAREFDRAIQDASRNSDEAGQNSTGPLPPGGGGSDDGDGGNTSGVEGPDLRYFPLTDGGNGERIAALFGADIRYCVEMKKWLVWDGRRWAVDEMNVMRQKGKMMARVLYVQAAVEAEPAKRSLLERHARASESYAAITAALGQAATEKGIPISVAELDQQPLLLNVMNGTVDLRTGTLLPHDRKFLITKLCPLKYDAKAECPRFLGFIEWAMGGNVEAELTERTVRLVGFLQRAFGYALTSDVSEKAVFILHGERGNNGKTTLLTLFRDMLGRDYSGQLVIDTVMTMKNQDATARADLADLRGSRLVVTSEVEKEHKLDEGKIKYITAGMGNIKSCRKYENPIEFQATHKLFMDCNHKPRVRGVDDAIWRRLKLVPFEVTISEEDKDLQLPKKLASEMSGILAWAVRGCLAWQADGLGDPPEVTSAGQEWREHDDPLKEFLDDCCEVNPESFVRASDLAAGYEWWAKQNRERYPLGREAFSERLQSKGFSQSRSRRIDNKQARTWEGIELKPEVVAAIRRRDTSHWQSDET